jgi:hypothetical protein
VPFLVANDAAERKNGAMQLLTRIGAGGVTAFSILLFIASLPFKAYCTGAECREGYILLLVGWLGIVDLRHPANLTWFANPLILFVWILTAANSAKARSFSLICLGIAASFIFAENVLIGASANGSTTTSFSIDRRFGYWLWLASIASAAVAAQLVEDNDPRAQ